ncbi:HEAT repeat domain-containing protein [Thermobaculum terrenum]|nr:HEAT repeat domain-containing protein [Thermobaculum terrenum]
MGLTDSLKRLLTVEGPMHQQDLIYLSDLSWDQMQELEAIWYGAPASRRVQLIKQLQKLANDDVQYNFKRIFLFALEDHHPAVRKVAVEGLWEEDSPFILEKLEGILLNDSSLEVRVSAAGVLSNYAYKSAVGELDDEHASRLQEVLQEVVQQADDGSELQRKALEALAFFEEDPIADDYIERLYWEGGYEEQASALIAMGRSMNTKWSSTIIKELGNPHPKLRKEAARAAGEMALRESVPDLIRLTQEDTDKEAIHAAIWALGQIGTPQAKRMLRHIANSSNKDLQSAAEEALDEAMYSGDI